MGQDTVVDQILTQAPTPQVAESMLLGSSFEGGWGPTFAVGDGGTSFGPFQMHQGGALTASGLSPAQAQDPAQAVAAMLGSYEAGVASVPASLWQTNPELAAEQAAVAAERPANSYLGAYGQATLDNHWAQVQQALTGGGTGANAQLTSSLNLNPADGFGIPGAIAGGVASEAKSAGAYIALIGAGLALVVLGVFKVANPGQTVKQTVKSATETAATAAVLAPK